MSKPFTIDSEIEMEDGREARIVGYHASIGLNGEDLVHVSFSGPCHKFDEEHGLQAGWWYSTVSGEFDGDQGRGNYYRIVHKQPDSNIPEEW